MKESNNVENISGSFRDPSNFLFYKDGEIFRQINRCYKENYEHMMCSGLYENLIEMGLLIPHGEDDIEAPSPNESYKIIKPEVIPFISYPYEWCFSQLKNAALTTLEIQKKALTFGMSLKDSSAYNIQFIKGKPLLIDTISFEKYREGQPWVAYKQFCQHFLAPLVLMNYKDIRLSQFLRIYIDGIPLDLVSSFLPFRTYLKPSLLTHIHFHSKSQKYFADKSVNIRKKEYKFGHLSFQGLIDSLESTVKKMTWRQQDTEWAEYYDDTNYSPDSFEHKKRLLSEYMDKINPESVWDLGANLGIFSRITSDKGIMTVSFDIDPAAVEKNYLECVKRGETDILPLLLDLANPSPGIGWEHEERMSLMRRGPADTILALALVHHLAISNNLPFKKICEFFKKICNSLIIEFIPKTDSQVQRLLSTREDIFPDYTQEVFEHEFSKNFKIQHSQKIIYSERTLYLMLRSST